MFNLLACYVYVESVIRMCFEGNNIAGRQLVNIYWSSPIISNHSRRRKRHFQYRLGVEGASSNATEYV